MNKSLLPNLSWVIAALLSAPLTVSATMAKGEYKTAKNRIGMVYKSDKAACASFNANAKDVCVEQAKGKEKLARAELEYAYSGTPQDANKVLVVKAESVYAVAKERCDDQSGNAKESCVQEAKAAEAAALADAKLGKQVKASIAEAAKEMTDAKDKAAVEKCEAMAGDAKAACLTAASVGSVKN